VQGLHFPGQILEKLGLGDLRHLGVPPDLVQLDLQQLDLLLQGLFLLQQFASMKDRMVCMVPPRVYCIYR